MKDAKISPKSSRRSATAAGSTSKKNDRAVLKRQPALMIVCGETGVGKTYRNRQEIKQYLSSKGARKGRKVLAFDTNDDDYPQFRTVSPDHLHKLTSISARRIRPFNRDGSPMDDEQKKQVVAKILKNYRHGLIVLDDIDHYMSGAKDRSMIGALCTIRHKGLDILLTHQSIAKITTTEWQNCTWLRLHHQVDDISRYRDRIPKYHLVRIGQHIVDEQYRLASERYRSGLIDGEEFKARKSYFVYLNMREQKIIGCSKPAFIRACKKFIDQEMSGKIKRMLLEKDLNDQPLYHSRSSAVLSLIEELLYHLD